MQLKLDIEDFSGGERIEPMIQVLLQYLECLRAGAVTGIVNGGELAELFRSVVQGLPVCGGFRLSEMKSAYQNIRVEVGYNVQDAPVGASTE